MSYKVALFPLSGLLTIAMSLETRDFLERMLSYSDPILNKESRATTITDVLDEAGKRLDRGEFVNQPEIRAELEESVGKIYVRQGRYELAYKHLGEAIAIQTRLYGEIHPKTW